MIVIDASVALAWVLPDEGEDLADRVFRIVETEGGIVPSVWSLEVGNGLAAAEQRGRLTKAQVNEAVSVLRRLPVRLADSAMESSLGQVLTIARRLKITTYDASYLELSLRVDCRLATLDRSLAEAAKKVEVATVA